MDPLPGLLERWDSRDPAVTEELLGLLYDELRSAAKRQFAGQAAAHTLQPTALVHEVFLKLVGSGTSFENRAHFFAVASKAMRQVLVNHARDRSAQKRGGGAKPSAMTDSLVGVDEGSPVEVLDLHAALEELAGIDERKHRLVELRFFGGLSMNEVAEVMGLSLSTVEAEWRACRAWLSVRLNTML